MKKKIRMVQKLVKGHTAGGELLLQNSISCARIQHLPHFVCCKGVRKEEGIFVVILLLNMRGCDWLEQEKFGVPKVKKVGTP